MREYERDLRVNAKKTVATVKIYHLPLFVLSEIEHEIQDYVYVGRMVIDGFSIDKILEKVWLLTQNDGAAWSLNPAFIRNDNAIAFRSSRVGDMFELVNIGFFKITTTGYAQIQIS